jgi:hypothetical protein
VFSERFASHRISKVSPGSRHQKVDALKDPTHLRIAEEFPMTVTRNIQKPEMRKAASGCSD